MIFGVLLPEYKRFSVILQLLIREQVFGMPKSAYRARLRDSYRFPGFTPALIVHGLFGDPHARVIPLTRRSKKRHAQVVAASGAAGMTANRGWCETFLRGALALTGLTRGSAPKMDPLNNAIELPLLP